MTKPISRIFGAALISNVITLILILTIGFILMGIVPKLYGVTIPEGFKAIQADRKASTVGEIIVLLSVTISALISGYIAPSFGKSTPILAGALSGVLIFVVLIVNIHPTDNDVPTIVKQLCFLSIPLLGATGGVLRQKIRLRDIRGRTAAIVVGVLAYGAVIVVGLLIGVVFKSVFVIATAFLAAVYCAIVAGTWFGKPEDRHIVLRLLIGIAIGLQLGECIVRGVAGILEKDDISLLIGTFPVAYLAFRSVRRLGWIQEHSKNPAL